MEEKNTKNNNFIVALLVIVGLLLSGVVGYFAFNLGKEAADFAENPGNKTEEKDENNTNGEVSIDELSLDNTLVTTIIDKFNMNYKDYPYWYGTVYEEQKLEDSELKRIALENSTSLLKDENNCNQADGTVYDGDGYGYKCKYISYTDFNKNYNSLTGKNLPKENLQFSGLNYLLYDSTNDIYRLCELFAGGGSDITIISKPTEAYKSGDYIFIYEKVAYFGWDGYGDFGYYITTPQKIDFVDYEDLNNSKYVEKIDIDQYRNSEGYTDHDKIINEHISKFETYKWSFKINSNGEYIFDSIIYVDNK